MLDIQSASEPKQNFTFIANISRLVDIEVYTFAPGQELRRAKAEEIVMLRKKIEPFFPFPQELYRDLWESRLSPNGQTYEALPEIDWRYFVIAFTGLNTTIENLISAFCLAPLELETIFTISYDRDAVIGITWDTSRLLQTLKRMPFNPDFFQEVKWGDLEAIRNIYELLLCHDKNMINIKRATQKFVELKAIPQSSDLLFLGYFAILESLLTHAPKPGDPYDSITRQVKNKISLLNERWSARLDYTPFNKVRPETVWERMYEYRSQLAHGCIPDFSDKELKVLHSAEIALSLVKDAAKAVARQALIEPRLIADLRKC